MFTIPLPQNYGKQNAVTLTGTICNSGAVVHNVWDL